MSRLNTTAAWAVPLVIALLSLLLSSASAYTRNDKELSNRISVLETKSSGDTRQLDHIQTQVDKLVEWALGKK